MLSDLTDLQESEENVWGSPKVSFDIETRSEIDGELIHRTYTFTYADEWDNWTFHEFEEKRTQNIDRVTARNWRRTRHCFWQDSKAADVDVPPEVTRKLEKLEVA